MTAQLSREWLQKTISGIETMREEMPFGLDEDGNNTLAALKLSLAGMDREPVAWWTGPEPTPTGEIESIHDHETGSHSIPLYAAPPAQPVGSEPVVTDSMALAFHQATTDSSAGSDDIDEIKAGLRAALANYAAPPAPVAVPDEWRSILQEMVNAMLAYEMDVGEPAPYKHRKMMMRAGHLLESHRAAMQAEPVTVATVPDGWTANSDANAALVMLDRLDTIDCADDERIDAIKSIIRRLAAAPEQEV